MQHKASDCNEMHPQLSQILTLSSVIRGKKWGDRWCVCVHLFVNSCEHTACARLKGTMSSRSHTCRCAVKTLILSTTSFPPYLPLSSVLNLFCSQTIWWTRPRWKPAKQKPLNWKRRWNKKRFIHIDRWEYLTHVYIHTNTSTQRPASDYSHIRQKRKSHIVKVNISPYTCKHNGIEMKFCATTVCLTGADKCLKKKKGGWWGCRKWLRK